MRLARTPVEIVPSSPRRDLLDAASASADPRGRVTEIFGGIVRQTRSPFTSLPRRNAPVGIAGFIDAEHALDLFVCEKDWGSPRGSPDLPARHAGSRPSRSRRCSSEAARSTSWWSTPSPRWFEGEIEGRW